jgi:MFS family permease
MNRESSKPAWLNRTSFGVGLTSLLSDWSHEIATAIFPAFLASLGAGPGWLGLIEGVADGASSFAKLAAGHYTDRWRRRKPLVVAGYAVTALATGALALAAHAGHALAARVAAWLGRGARGPGRNTLLAAAVPPEAYGRAFGFERMMDTGGAILGPLCALWLLQLSSGNYATVFLWTLLPGLLALACFAVLVRERPAAAGASRRSFQAGLRDLPAPFKRFLLAVGVFGLGDFSHTLLILYATQALTPRFGAARAASLAIGFYLLHNVFYALSAFAGGWLGDHVRRRARVLAAGYAMAVVTAALLVTGQQNPVMLGAVFLLAGVFVGIEEALENSVAAEMVPADQHGMAFGTLAAVNAVGDFVSSLLVGFLWARFSAVAAFAAAGFFFLFGTFLLVCLRGTGWQRGQK